MLLLLDLKDVFSYKYTIQCYTLNCKTLDILFPFKMNFINLFNNNNNFIITIIIIIYNVYFYL